MTDKTAAVLMPLAPLILTTAMESFKNVPNTTSLIPLGVSGHM